MRISRILTGCLLGGALLLACSTFGPLDTQSVPEGPCAVGVLYAAEAEGGTPPKADDKNGGGETGKAESWEFFGKVGYNAEGHKIKFSGEINMRDSQKEPMELLACTPGGKTHETVVSADILPSDLHNALLRAGMNIYPYPGRLAADRQDLLGSRAIVWIIWKENGQEKKLRAEDTLLDTRLNRPMGRWGWAFVGQYETVVDPETGKKGVIYKPNQEKSLVTSYHSPNTVLDNPRSIGAFDSDFISNTAAIPELKTKVTIFIEPATEERIVSENLKDEKGLVDSLKDKLSKMKEAEASEEAMAVSGQLKLAAERVKWLETLVPLAKQADALNQKIQGEINPKINAQTDELAKAAKALDKKAMEKLNAELEMLYTQREVALKELQRAYHYYYRSIGEREAADGKVLKIAAKNQTILDDDVAFYTGKQENVENEFALAKLELRKLQQNAALASTNDPPKQLELKIALAELNRDEKILLGKITIFHLQPQTDAVQSYIKTAEKNLSEAKAKNDDELVQAYQKEIEGHNARLEYLKDRTEALTIRRKTAELECTVEVSKLKGEAATQDLVNQLQQLDAKASLLEKRARLFELNEQLKSVSEDLDLEIQGGGDPDLIKELQQKKKDIEDKIATLKSDIEKIDKSRKEEKPGK